MREIQRQQKRRDDFSKTRAVTEEEGDTCVLMIKDWTLKERQAGLGM